MELYWISVAIVFLLLFYLYLKIKYNYWKRKGVPSVETLWFLGSYGTRWNEPQGCIELEWCKKHGRIFGIYEGFSPTLMVSDPDLVKEILIRDFNQVPNQRKWRFGDPILDHMIITLEGDEWRRVKSILAPVFSTAKVKKMTKHLNFCARTLEKNFQQASKSGKPFNSAEYFNAYIMDAIARCAFSIVTDAHNDPKNPFVSSVTKIFDTFVPWRTILTGLFPGFCSLINFSIVDTSSTRFFYNAVIELLEQRKAYPKETYGDFLQWLLDDADISDASKNGHESNGGIVPKKLNYDEILSQCVLFFMVGFVTSAATLTFAAYNLAANPHCQEKLLKEIKEVVKDKEIIEYEDVQNMTYLDAVISEALRFYSPVPRVSRMGDVDYTLGNTGIVIPKRTLIGIPIYAIHQDPEWFPEPNKFDPDRFSPENKHLIRPYTYLPFGLGPRNCLGMRFTQLEMKICLIRIFRKFHFSTCPESKLTMDFGAGLEIHRPKEALVEVKER